MYIDNTNLLRIPRRHFHWKFNKHGRAQRVYTNAGLRVVRLEHEYNEFSYGLDLSSDKALTSIVKNLGVCKGIKVVYTKLDLTQTCKQLQLNKYYKTFIRDNQVIKNYD